MAKSLFYAVELEQVGEGELQQLITLNEGFKDLGEEVINKIQDIITNCTLELQRIIKEA